MKYWVKNVTFIVLEFPLQEKKRQKRKNIFFLLPAPWEMKVTIKGKKTCGEICDSIIFHEMPTAIFVWNFGRIQDFNLGEKLGKVSGSFIDFLIWNFTLKSGRRWKSVPSKSHKMSLLSLKWAKAVVSKLRPETWNSSSIFLPPAVLFSFLAKIANKLKYGDFFEDMLSNWFLFVL